MTRRHRKTIKKQSKKDTVFDELKFELRKLSDTHVYDGSDDSRTDTNEKHDDPSRCLLL